MAVANFAIMGFQPTQGPSGTNVTITLFGLPDFYEGTRVYIGAAEMTYLGKAGRDSIRVVVPDGATSDFIYVQIDDGDRGYFDAQSAQQFTVTAGDVTAVRIVSVGPANVQPGGLAFVTGSGLNSVQQVSLGPTIQVQTFQKLPGGARINFSVPSTTPPGDYPVILHTTTSGSVRSTSQLRVVARGDSN